MLRSICIISVLRRTHWIKMLRFYKLRFRMVIKGFIYILNSKPISDKPKEKNRLVSIRILFLCLNPNLQGPLPKLAPLLIAILEKLGCQVTRRAWGHHSENENLIEKIFGRLKDVSKALVILARMKPDIMYVDTTLDEYALTRDIPLLLVTYWSPAKKVLMMNGSQSGNLVSPGHK